MTKELERSSIRDIRDLLEQSSVPLSADPKTRALQQIDRTVEELQAASMFAEDQPLGEFVHLEYDKFNPGVQASHSRRKTRASHRAR